MSEADALAAARNALLDYLPRTKILARYEAAGGQELISGKFANPESSAALAANAFGIFIEHPEWLSLPKGLVASGDAESVMLEAHMRFPWSGGLHPWLDAGIETANAIIGIESKRYEPFRDRKKAEFSEAYSRPVWGEAMGPYEAMRDALTAGHTFRHLDAAQLVKHAFGLRTQAHAKGRKAVLCYVYAEPRAYPDGRLIPSTEIEVHCSELSEFTAAVAPAIGRVDVDFHSFTYAELLELWSAQASLQHHATALATRFDLQR